MKSSSRVDYPTASALCAAAHLALCASLGCKGQSSSPVLAGEPVAATTFEGGGKTDPSSAGLRSSDEGGPRDGSAAAHAPRWSADLGLGKLSDVPKVLDSAGDQAFGTLARGGESAMPKTCREWAALHAGGYEPKNTLEAQADGGAKIRCGTLSWLEHATPARASYLDGVRWDGSALAVLPAGLATAVSPEERARATRATAAHQSLKDFEPKARAKKSSDGDGIEVREGAGSTILVDEQARADVDGDGVEDLVLAVTNAEDQGSYFEIRLVLLTRRGPSGPLQLVRSQ